MSAFSLDALVREAAERSPDRVAVVSPSQAWTYGELEQAVSATAAELRALGVRPRDRVGVWAAKSPRSIAALYGAMRAGAAYVPIDPLAPEARAAGVLADCGARVVCADRAHLARLGTVGAGILDLDAELGPPDAVPPVACESDLAYILYTSGSTGRPKGVMLTHRNALAFVEWAVGRFAVDAADRLSSHAPFHFDLSVFDLYAAAFAGAELHLLEPGQESMGREMSAAIRERRLTVWYSVPSALVLLATAADREDLATLRVVLFAGEVFPMKHLRRLRDLVPKAALANLYGPTETNVCTYFAVGGELPAGDQPLPIGRSCENQEVFALDDSLRPVPDGEVGELWVRGPTVMKGYWGDEQLTAARLRQNPLHERYPDPAYRTGDLVRRLEDGDYEFLGRRDHQVKVRGYRIELGEIEMTLTAHPAVREAAVVAVDDERAGAKLIGFVAADARVEEMELRRHCSRALPRYMVPQAVVVGRELPHTSTGKIDRRELTARAVGELAGAR